MSTTGDMFKHSLVDKFEYSRGHVRVQLGGQISSTAGTIFKSLMSMLITAGAMFKHSLAGNFEYAGHVRCLD